MTMHQVIPVDEFKDQCLALIAQLEAHELSRVTVTHDGRAVAVLMPPAVDEQTARAVHGSMAGSVKIPPGFDLTAPIFEGEIDAELGILHR